MTMFKTPNIRNAVILFLFVAIIIDRTHSNEICRIHGAFGICENFEKCNAAQIDLENGIKKQFCRQSPNKICCLYEALSSQRLSACPALPVTKYNIKKIGQKAWNQCKEIIEYMHPCDNGIRENVCHWMNSIFRRSVIVGGTPAKPSEFPHMARLGYVSEEDNKIHWNCGGSLISKNWVLTAAHCTYDNQLGVDVTRVQLTNLNTYTVKDTVIHPDYSYSKSVYNDIALIQLGEAVNFTRFAIPACLHIGNELNDDEMIATGYGALNYRGQPSDRLIKVTLNKFNHTDCRAKHAPSKKLLNGIRNDTQMCAGHRTEIKDSCQGDSGGPIQVLNDDDISCTYTILGVTSFGKKCGLIGVPGIYTRVSAFIPWIESVVWP